MAALMTDEEFEAWMEEIMPGRAMRLRRARSTVWRVRMQTAFVFSLAALAIAAFAYGLFLTTAVASFALVGVVALFEPGDRSDP